MSLETELTNYVQTHDGKTTAEIIEFLTKLWHSGLLKSSTKYEIILKFFAKQCLDDEKVGKEELLDFLKLKHPANSISNDTKRELVKKLSKLLKKNSDFCEICLELASNESFKDFFKLHLDFYAELMELIVKSAKPELLPAVISELYCFANLEQFKILFLEKLLVPLDEIFRRFSIKNDEKFDLLGSIFFSQVATADANLEIFETELEMDQKTILYEVFIRKNKTRPEQILRLVEFVCEKNSEDFDFLTQIKEVFALMQLQGIDVSLVKRINLHLFEKIAIRANKAIEASKSMDFGVFLEILASLVSSDAFLFENNIFSILVDCMFREKSESDLESYQKFVKVVVKIYGKDLSQFLKKLLKSIDEHLENFSIPKKRKRKQPSVDFEVAKKKQKLADGEKSTDFFVLAHVWPESTKEIFSEAVSALNVAQTINIWTQLNDFLTEALKKLKNLSTIDENVLFKIDFASALLSELFLNTRIQEQLMYKKEKIEKAIASFNSTQDLFNGVLLSIEYNSRVVNSFLDVVCSYERFLMLYFYHQNLELKNEVFTGNSLKNKNEWQIIQQRIRNFGKIDEKNKLNLLSVLQSQKAKLFGFSSGEKFEDCLAILSDEKQVEFMLKNVDTRAIFINALESNDLKIFSQFLICEEQKEVRSLALKVIAQKSELLNKFVVELLQNDDAKGSEVKIEVLNELPLSQLSDDNKKIIFEAILEEKLRADSEKVEEIVQKLLEGENYKTILKDFAMKKIVKFFDDTEKFAKVHQTILNLAVRKIGPETLKSFEWILKSSDRKLISHLAQAFIEIPTSTSGVTAEALKEFKKELTLALLSSVAKIDVKKMSSIDCNEVQQAAKLFVENSALLEDEKKVEFAEKLEKIVLSVAQSPTTERVRLLLLILKDSAKFNLKDKTKASVVTSLQSFLTSTVVQEKSEAESQDVELEKQIFTALKAQKSNFQENCVEAMRENLNRVEKTGFQLRYSLKIYEIALNCAEKSSSGVVKSYLKFCDENLEKILQFGAEVLITLLETNNAILSDASIQLENTSVDKFLCLPIDHRIDSKKFTLENFCKFLEAVGELLFVIANVRQNFFKSRISQFFNVYRNFMETIYFYKNEDGDELEPIGTSLMLKLALQLENIMKMIVKKHSPSIKIVSLYFASCAVNIFVKNPKMLSKGAKFQMNLKNTCHQLLAGLDDKTRKHIYCVADETSREVYDEIFKLK